MCEVPQAINKFNILIPTCFPGRNLLLQKYHRILDGKVFKVQRWIFTDYFGTPTNTSTVSHRQGHVWCEGDAKAVFGQSYQACIKNTFAGAIPFRVFDLNGCIPRD